MPLVKIEIIEGKTNDYKNAVLVGVHHALVNSLGIPDNDRFGRLYELPYNNFEYPPDRTMNVTIIEITMFKGRSLKAKRDLYQSIVNILGKNPGIDGQDIMIILNEPPLENWGVRGGKPASEVDFDFDIEV
jgi:phenylpyruvate tautomerase PptA (4-oxalocrotonate tautomerase family)